jgi:hypothetical protein
MPTVKSFLEWLTKTRRHAAEKLKISAQSARAEVELRTTKVLMWFKRSKTRLRIASLTWWYKYQSWAFGIFAAAAFVAAATLLSLQWCHLNSYLSELEKSVVPGLLVGIGAAITGIIAIAFSLSLFAIQQVADRGTPATVQAYARDRVLKSIYWSLVVLATICFTAALLKSPTPHGAAAVVIGLLSLLLSFVLLNIHFRRVVNFADPRYTVSRIYKQGTAQLKRLEMLRSAIVPGNHTDKNK